MQKSFINDIKLDIFTHHKLFLCRVTCSCICVANTSLLWNAYNRRNQLDSGEVHASEQVKGLFHRFAFVNIKTGPGEKWCMLLHFRNLATRGKTLSSPSCPNKSQSTHWAGMQRVLRPRHMKCIMETYCIEIVCARIPGMEKNGALWSAPWGPELPECAQTDCKASFTSRSTHLQRHWKTFAYL